MERNITLCTVTRSDCRKLWIEGRPPRLYAGTTKTCIADEAMTYEQLIDFLEHRMSMSHVYQPLLVRALVDAGGVATIRQLAQVFLAQDESQLLYYEKRIREMPLKVLKGHEVITSDG